MSVWLGILAAATALASPYVKPSREPMPAREVERGVVLPKGWTEVTLDVSRKVADEAWGRSGEPKPLGLSYRAWTESLVVRHGVLRGHEGWIAVPWTQVRIAEEEGGAEVRGSGLGGPSFGWRLGLLRREPPSRALALELGWQAAAPELAAVPLGASSPELDLGLAARLELGAVAVGARGTYGHRLTGRIGEALVDPGDVLIAELDVMLQAGPLLFGALPRVTQRGEATLVDEGVLGEREGIADSGCLCADLQARIVVALTRAIEVGVVHHRPILGEGFAFPFVEPLSPTLGATWAGRLTVRF